MLLIRWSVQLYRICCFICSTSMKIFRFWTNKTSFLKRSSWAFYWTKWLIPASASFMSPPAAWQTTSLWPSAWGYFSIWLPGVALLHTGTHAEPCRETRFITALFLLWVWSHDWMFFRRCSSLVSHPSWKYGLPLSCIKGAHRLCNTTPMCPHRSQETTAGTQR